MINRRAAMVVVCHCERLTLLEGGLKVLKQARLPKWRGCFQWQIEAQIEALQTAYARLHTEVAKPDG